MKKFKLGIIALVFVCASLIMTACGSKVSIEKLKVQYTANLQLLVGEEWHDELIKGTAYYSDDTEKDVTEELEIDLSQYNKDIAGKHKVKFSYDGISVDYEVEVVNKFTNSALINERLVKVVENTFKRNDGVLSFEATRTSELRGESFTELMLFEDNNGEISYYIKCTLDDYIVFESRFNGTDESGDMDYRLADSQVANVYEIGEYEDVSFDYCLSKIKVIGQGAGITNVVDPKDILSLQEGVDAGELSHNNGVYTLASEGDEWQYKNNVITSFNGAELKFPKVGTAPNERKTIQDYMDEVVENTFKRNDGVLSFEATKTSEISDKELVETLVFEENDGEISSYIEWTLDSEVVLQSKFEGTAESGNVHSVINSKLLDEEDSLHVSEYEYVSFDVCLSDIEQIAEAVGISNIVKPEDILSLENRIYVGELTYDSGVYTFTDGYDELQYENNVITSFNEIELKFPKVKTVPTYSTIQDYMDDIIETSYERSNDGKLEMVASETYELDDGAVITHDMVIQENNGEYVIYDKFTATNSSTGASATAECWFEGALNNGKITVRSNIPDEGIEVVSQEGCNLYQFQELFIDFEPSLYPSTLINLETEEFSGYLYYETGGDGSLEQEVAPGMIFTLIFVDNTLTMVNGAEVEFRNAFTEALIPEIPEVTAA